MFVDECEIYDLERIESWRDVLDVLLVFVRPLPSFVFSPADSSA